MFSSSFRAPAPCPYPTPVPHYPDFVPRLSPQSEERGSGGRSGTPSPGALGWAGPRRVTAGGSPPEPPEPSAGANLGGAEKGGGTWDAAGAGRVGRNQQRTPGREAESADKTQPSYHPAPVTSPGPTCSMSATAQSLPAPAAVRLGSPGSASERNRISRPRHFRR